MQRDAHTKMVVPEKMANAVVSEEMEKKVEINLGEVGKTVEMNDEDAEKSVNGEKDENTFNDKDATECVTEEADSY